MAGSGEGLQIDAMPAHALAEKFRRALRNGTGATFTNADLRYLGRLGVLVLLAEVEAQELCGTPVDAAFSKPEDGPLPNRRERVRRPTPESGGGNAYSPQTLAERWSCSAQKVRAMCRSGELASFTYGKLIRISAAEVARFEGQRSTRPQD